MAVCWPLMMPMLSKLSVIFQIYCLPVATNLVLKAVAMASKFAWIPRLTSGLKLPGIVECPTSHPLVKSSLEGATRKLARPVQPKEPLSVNTVCRIADHYISSSSLAVIRFLFIVLVGFAGFYRMGEIRSLSIKDVSICSEYMSVFIPKRENDQYREGHTSLLARSHKATCPVSITERLLKLLPLFIILPPRWTNC